MFKANHPDQPVPAGMKFRLRLLRFTTLYTRRLTPCTTAPSMPALRDLRTNNKAQVDRWSASRVLEVPQWTESVSAPEDTLQRNRLHVLNQLSVRSPEAAEFYGTPESVSLHDLLPLFLDLSAESRQMQNSSTKRRWMEMAAEWMLQASLEQFLIYGTGGPEKIADSFVWGYMQQADMSGSHSESDLAINALFQQEGGDHQVDGWDDVHRQLLGEVRLAWHEWFHQRTSRRANTLHSCSCPTWRPGTRWRAWRG